MFGQASLKLVILQNKGAVVKHFILKTSLMLPIAALAAMAQTPTSPLAFEVATIKLAEPITPAMVQAGKMHAGMSIDAARVDIGYVSLYDLLASASRSSPIR